MRKPPVDRSRFRPGAITYIDEGAYWWPWNRSYRMIEGGGISGPEPILRDPLLQERERTHGNYSVQAGWAQAMKTMMRSTPLWNDTRGAQKESLDMIITKISRILHGDNNHLDSWQDISGYAKLGEENCK